MCLKLYLSEYNFHIFLKKESNLLQTYIEKKTEINYLYYTGNFFNNLTNSDLLLINFNYNNFFYLTTSQFHILNNKLTNLTTLFYTDYQNQITLDF